MNGARAVLQTLVDAGVDTCFMNPGTSEMHFVAALDDVPAMRSTLALFEGVATGAADGYARMARRPAATLLHLGPGLGNGVANLHNARRAASPVVNIVGDHAQTHHRYDAPLESDIETVARNVSRFVRRATQPATVGIDVADTIAASQGPPGQVATLVLPADVSWSEGAAPAIAPPPRAATVPAPHTIAEITAALRSGTPCALLVGGSGCAGRALALASAVAESTGARLLAETFPARLERGAGRPPVERLAYLAELAVSQLDGLAHLVLVGARSPVSFFAYPGKPSDLVPAGCHVHHLGDETTDVEAALDILAGELGVTEQSCRHQQHEVPGLPDGALTAQSLAVVLGALLPEGAIVSDEGNTLGLFAPGATACSPPHDWLCLAGGAIGQGLPVAVGAATACPDRPVIAFEADGSALYTLQSWWTMARSGLDVTTVVLRNGSYAVLNMELQRVGAHAGGPAAKRMLDLTDPDLDFVALAAGMGVPGEKVDTADGFAVALRRALAAPGPRVIEAIVPSLV